MPKATKESPTTLADLQPNTKNPRKPWSSDQLATFRDSLIKFGDLGGIVRNLTTNQLIGGHKRVEAFREGQDVQLVTTPQDPDDQGTVAHGYVIVDGNRFAYREVRWSIEQELAANLAANRWGADWDWKLVAGALKTISDDDLLALTGFEEHELKNLMAADWSKPEQGDLMGADGTGDHHVTLTAVQYHLLTTAKTKLDPLGGIGDALAIETMCRQLIERTTE